LEEEEGPANGVSRVKWADYKEIESKRRTDKEKCNIRQIVYLYDRRQSNPPTKSQHPLPETPAGGAGDGGSSGPSLELLILENKNL
jgi:hypothetical protein